MDFDWMTVETKQPVKTAAGIEDGAPPVRYGDVWQVEHTSGPDRLRIGPSADHVDVLLSLADTLEGDFYLLYVPVVAEEPGRYQSPALTRNEVAEFCRRFEPFLRGDARHHLWIKSSDGPGLLIYDRHDWIWAYGDLPAYIEVLRQQGFREGEVMLPSPHAHHYHHDAFAGDVDAILDWFDWTRTPLRPGDDD
jgi:hypothetical protein